MEQHQQPNLRSLLLLNQLPKVARPGQPIAQKPISRPVAKPSVKQSPKLEKPEPAVNVPAILSPGIPAQFSLLIPALMTLKGQMIQELEEHLGRLFTLNPSRREAIAQYLDRLASQSAAPSASEGVGDAAGGLRRWVEGPRSESQNAALRCYFEEVALMFLGQALLLKSWNDRGLRRFSEPDVGNPNWPISTALKAHVPVDREGWQFTRPNIYSWYRPSAAIQRQIWLTLEQARTTDEGPSLILAIAGPSGHGRQAHPEAAIPQGYDHRFFKALWNSMPTLGLDLASDNGPIKRHRVAFSPTLRDGTMVRTGPIPLSWTGMESSPFQMMISELMQLWWGPLTPPLWAIGSGLEAHTRDQLLLALSSAKPSLLSRIADMEACDVALVLEEKIVRSQGRNADASRLRAQLDSLPYFKKLKSPGTSLGDLQACVALSKLRPGGALWWAREEPLSQQDGSEVLAFLLDRGKLVCEWDLSSLEHQLPVSLPLFPRYLYLFSRESEVEARLGHRPLRISVSGQIRSHIEVPVMLEDLLQSAIQSGARQTQARGQWQIHVQTSPTPQKDWADRWPDLACQDAIRALEKLRVASVPIANISTVRSMPENALPETFPGIWIQSGAPAPGSEGGRRLQVRSGRLPVPAASTTDSDGYLILLPDASWVAPIAAYLRSSTVRHWLDHHAERKGERWILSEQVVRWVPIPKRLLNELGQGGSLGSRADLPADWAKLLAEVGENGKSSQNLRARLSQLPDDDASLEIRTSIFVRAAQMLDNLEVSKNNLLSLVGANGKLAWRQLFDLIPKTEFAQITVHPRVSITGNLPLHMPISRMERVKSPQAGILLATEVGMFIHLSSDRGTVLDMLWEQLENAKHPTWSELVQSLRLPRKIEFAQSTAEDVLRSHAEVSSRVHALSELLSDCSVY